MRVIDGDGDKVAGNNEAEDEEEEGTTTTGNCWGSLVDGATGTDAGGGVTITVCCGSEGVDEGDGTGVVANRTGIGEPLVVLVDNID
jgi:hypothetical protein